MGPPVHVPTSDVASNPNRIAIIVGYDPNAENTVDLHKLVQLIINPDTESNAPSTDVYKWTMDNKYYTADVDVTIVHSPADGDVVDLGNVDAIILLTDGLRQADTLSQIEKQWLASITMAGPEIRLLVEAEALMSPTAVTTTDASVAITTVMSWAVTHEFEYIDPEEDAEDPKSVGFGRIREALHAHVWPDLEMKSQQRQQQQQQPTETLSALAVVDTEQDTTTTTTPVPAPLTSITSATTTTATVAGFNLDSLLASMDVLAKEDLDNGDEDDVDMFATMLDQMQLLKAQATSLPDEQRKAFAEKVALKFYESLGGGNEDDEDDDDDDDDDINVADES